MRATVPSSDAELQHALRLALDSSGEAGLDADLGFVIRRPSGKRDFAVIVNFSFLALTADARRVRRVIEGLRATPAVYYPGPDTEQFGALVYGFVTSFDIPLQAGTVCFPQLEIQGLT